MVTNSRLNLAPFLLVCEAVRGKEHQEAGSYVAIDLLQTSGFHQQL